MRFFPEFPVTGTCAIIPDKLGSPSEVCVAGTDNRVAFLASDGTLRPARLIASAPDLLSLVKRFVALAGGAWHPERHAAEEAELMSEARDLIAELEGQHA